MKKIILSLSFLIISLAVFAQQNAIYYEVNFPNAVHHEAEITMLLRDVPSGPLKIRMSRSSPGRYATHEFGKNVYNLKAFDGSGKELKITQPAGDEYTIPNHGVSVSIKYTIFGNWIDGTYAGFDETHAHMNMPATFIYPIGWDNRARKVKFIYDEKLNWKVATQLKQEENGVYSAPNLQYFMDSPTEISAYKSVSWDVKSPDGKIQTIHLISHSNDELSTVDNYATMLKKVVAEQEAVWGELPKFDHGNYYFLHDVLPQYAGDGMEHRNSTVIVQRTPKIAGYESGLLGTFSHEFFHAWNVERLRPKTLEPFNFEHSNISDGLWLAEGFTQYYGNLLLTRAGFRTHENAAQTFNGIVNTVLTSPGAQNFSPVQASQYAVFADAGVAIDQTNKSNIFTSYYIYGASVALALDLRLRAEFKLTLDDYMKALWKAHGKPEIPYTMQDLEKVLAQLTKNEVFAADFFKNYVHGTAKNDYAKLLLNAGYVLRKANPGKAFTGFGRVNFEDGKATLGATLKGTPAYSAGLDIDNILLTVDGSEVKDQASLTKIIEAKKPGDVIEIIYTYHGQEKKTQLTLAENPALEIVSIEKTGGILTSAMQTFRDNWLNSQIK
ncbi:MAG: M61 family peptidase [Flavobacterium sp.]|nr:MAG: M61 family peptidase [Flavobacterium sp.]